MRHAAESEPKRACTMHILMPDQKTCTENLHSIHIAGETPAPIANI